MGLSFSNSEFMYPYYNRRACQLICKIEQFFITFELEGYTYYSDMLAVASDSSVSGVVYNLSVPHSLSGPA